MHRETIHYRISSICGNIPIFVVTQQPYSALGRSIVDVCRSHTIRDAPQSAGLLRTSDQPDAGAAA